MIKKLKYSNKLKKILTTISIIVISLIFIQSATAATSYTLTKKDKIYYTSSGVIASSGSSYIVEHYFGSISAYCIQWTKSTVNGSKYTEWTNSTYFTTKNRIIAGKVIELGESKYGSNEKQKHLYITEALNCLFKISGYKCYTKSPGYSLLTEAQTWYQNNVKTCSGTNTSGCFNYGTFKLNLNNQSTMMPLNNSNTNFISSKITLSGMLSSYGGSGTSYSISATASKGTAQICTDPSGTNCTSTYTMTNKEGTQDFYVKVTNSEANATVKITAKGTNSATYPYSTAYRYTSTYQALMIPAKTTRTRNVNVSVSLSAPDINHYSIRAKKVDESGNDLNGASFAIYGAQDSNGTGKTELKKNSNGSYTATYSFDQVEGATTKYPYYCLGETSAPNGYIFGENEQKLTCISSSKLETSSSMCYKDGTEVSDKEYCESHDYVCETGTGELNGTKCELKDSSLIISSTEDNSTDTCEDGYIWDESSQQCISNNGNIISDEKDANSNFSCSNSEYIYENDTCVKRTDAICKNSTTGSKVDIKYCQADDSSSYNKITTGNGNIDFIKVNVKTTVEISKTDITGTAELDGANMKICTDKPDDSLNCTVATITQNGTCSDEGLANEICKNNDDGTKTISLEWVSETISKSWSGLETDKTYYLVETIAPYGYKTSTYTSFTISKDGTVKSGDTVVSDNKIVVKNDLSKITVSKQDVATSKELPGATLKICNSGKDENDNLVMSVDQEGNCSIATLEDGTDAIWISTDTPKEISGLPAGTYYLVEEIAPLGYSTAESIIFKLAKDGTLTDKDGKSLKDNKLVMKDATIKDVKTGDLPIIIIVVIGLGAASIGGYYYIKNKKSISDSNNETRIVKKLTEKVRKRKIHK